MTLPPCDIPAIVDQVYTVGIAAHGHTIGGTGVLTMDGGRWSLMLLSPGGLALFTASGPPDTVTTGIPAWAPYLERLPFARDMLLAFSVGERCTAGGGTLRTRGTSTRWRGPGGRAIAEHAPDRVIVHDPLRGYTLTLVPAVPAAASPAQEGPDAP